MAKFTLTIEDNGEDIEMSHDLSEPWDGKSQPPPSYFLGGMVVNYLSEILDFTVIEDEETSSDVDWKGGDNRLREVTSESQPED